MAFEFDETVVVDKPIGEVFAFLDDDVDNFAEWRRPPWMRLERLTEPPIGVGTRYETAVSILGIQQGPITTEVTVYEPPERLVWTALNSTTLLAEAGGEYLLAEEAAGTKVTISGRVRFPWWLRPFEPLGKLVFNSRYLKPMMQRLRNALQP